jgi:hypothetical protein
VEVSVKYVILIYSNPKTREMWEGYSDAERAEGWRAYGALTADLTASGELIVAEALSDPSQAKRITARDGRPVTTDGPFAEVKELLAGFFLIECKSFERAIEHAARVPEAEFGLVEVRPVLDVSGMDM